MRPDAMLHPRCSIAPGASLTVSYFTGDELPVALEELYLGAYRIVTSCYNTYFELLLINTISSVYSLNVYIFKFFRLLLFILLYQLSFCKAEKIDSKKE